MSGHSKWHSIKHKKGAADAARGKVFSRHAKLITIAARGGGDPAMNPALRMAIDLSKKDNMPNANIERAIKKGTGEDKDGAQLAEISLEGYGPEGVAILVHAITDNKNRTVSNVRAAFNKYGGNMGTEGSVSWMFHKKGFIELAEMNENLEMAAIENGAEDISDKEITCDPKDFDALKKALEAAGAKITEAGVELIPENTVKITDEAKAKQLLRLMSVLEEDEDTDTVSANFDISEELMEKAAE